MYLSEFLKKTNKFLIYKNLTNFKIKNICNDSRKIKLGDIFIAIKGIKTDGHNYIDEAIKKGAVLIITQKKIKNNIPYLLVKNTRKYIANIACLINNNPSKKIKLIGITGTNGKTTTSYIIEKILKNAGYKVGLIGTISYKYNQKKIKPYLTTPEPLELQNIFKKMVHSKITHVIMEVSSHAIDLKRIYGCNFDIAVFTNLSQDHLDYHKNIKNYWKTKKKLFTKYLNKDGISIINIDDNKGKKLIKIINKNTLTTSIYSKSNIKAKSIKFSNIGTKGKIITPKGNFKFKSSLIGEFNLNNILSATATAISMNIPIKNIYNGIKKTKNIPGRLEIIKNSKKLYIYIDYAHTPDAIKNILKTISSTHKGNIITIFGCGGDRDKSKRSLMGKIAVKYSKTCIITLDNPRLENQKKITFNIINGIIKKNKNYVNPKILIKKNCNKKKYTVIYNREKAISIGLNSAKKGDIILILGKGHENKQIIKNNIFSFNDKKKAKKFIKILYNFKN